MGQITIDDPMLSRRHIRIDLSGAAPTVEDLQSRNGTQLNGRTLDRSRDVDRWRPNSHRDPGAGVPGSRKRHEERPEHECASVLQRLRDSVSGSEPTLPTLRRSSERRRGEHRRSRRRGVRLDIPLAFSGGRPRHRPGAPDRRRADDGPRGRGARGATRTAGSTSNRATYSRSRNARHGLAVRSGALAGSKSALDCMGVADRHRRVRCSRWSTSCLRTPVWTVRSARFATSGLKRYARVDAPSWRK